MPDKEQKTTFNGIVVPMSLVVKEQLYDDPSRITPGSASWISKKDAEGIAKTDAALRKIDY